MRRLGRTAVTGWARRAVASGLVVLALALCPQATMAGSGDQAARAATILRMLRFVDWQARHAPGADLRVAVVGNAPLGAALRAARDAMQPGGRTVTVVDVASTRALADANAAVVIVGALPAAGSADLARRLSDQAVLTVGDGDCPDDTGLMLNLFADGDRYRVQANPAAAARAGVSLSSRLLRLAHIVN